MADAISGDCPVSGDVVINAKVKKDAYDWYSKIVAKLTHESWRLCQKKMRHSWRIADVATDKRMWLVLGDFFRQDRALLDHFGMQSEMPDDSSKPGSSQQNPKVGQAVVAESSCGIALTYNTDAGLLEPETMAAAQAMSSAQDFIEFAKNNPFHNVLFERFWDFIEKLGEDLSLGDCGCLHGAQRKRQTSRSHTLPRVHRLQH